MVKAVKEAMSKTAILAACAEETGFTKKECGQVLDALSGTIESCIMKVRAPQNPDPTLKRARSLGTPGGARKNACTPSPRPPDVCFPLRPQLTVLRASPPGAFALRRAASAPSARS